MSGRAPLVVDAIKKHTATVIMAHGLGDSGAGWIDLATSWRRRGKFENVKFVFPNAPNIPITINMGMQMPGWYDIVRPRGDGANLDFNNDLDQAHDETGIVRSRTYFTRLITDEITAGIPSNRIILGGFSQGGAISLFTGLTTPHKLGGVFGLSSYLLLGSKIKELVKEADQANKDTPFFMAHGDADQVVQYVWGQKTAQFIKDELGHKLDFRTYRGLPHSADVQEIDDLESFIKGCLADSEPTGSEL